MTRVSNRFERFTNVEFFCYKTLLKYKPWCRFADVVKMLQYKYCRFMTFYIFLSFEITQISLCRKFFQNDVFTAIAKCNLHRVCNGLSVTAIYEAFYEVIKNNKQEHSFKTKVNDACCKFHNCVAWMRENYCVSFTAIATGLAAPQFSHRFQKCVCVVLKVGDNAQTTNIFL